MPLYRPRGRALRGHIELHLLQSVGTLAFTMSSSKDESMPSSYLHLSPSPTYLLTQNYEIAMGKCVFDAHFRKAIFIMSCVSVIFIEQRWLSVRRPTP